MDFLLCARVVNAFVWRRGRVNAEALQTKLNSIIKYSLWDIYTERFLRDQPIIVKQPSEVYAVNPLCIQYLAKWIAFGAHISVPLAHHSHTECEYVENNIIKSFSSLFVHIFLLFFLPSAPLKPYCRTTNPLYRTSLFSAVFPPSTNPFPVPCFSCDNIAKPVQ